MPHEVGVKLLLHRFGDDIDHNNYMTVGVEIVNRLGGLALAIEQASAFMYYRCIQLDQLHTFAPIYDAEREKVLTYTTPYFWNYMDLRDLEHHEHALSAFTTWEMSITQLLSSYERKEDVVHFFTLTAFLGPTSIDEVLFKLHSEMSNASRRWVNLFSSPSTRREDTLHASSVSQQKTYPLPDLSSEHSARVARLYHRFGWRGDQNAGPPIRTDPKMCQATETKPTYPGHRSWSVNSFWDLISNAFHASLLTSILPAVGPTGASFLLHPLIRDWLQLRQDLRDRQAYTREAIEVLSNIIQKSEHESVTAPMKLTILLHMDAVLLSDKEYFEEQSHFGRSTSTLDEAEVFADYYADQGRYIEAESMWQLVVESRIKVSGIHERSTLESMSCLAEVSRARGNYSEAERLQRIVLEVSGRTLGIRNPSTIAVKNNLATTLTERGQYSEAEQMLRWVIAVNMEEQGQEHPDTLLSTRNLAMVLKHRGRYDDAVRLCRGIVEIQTRSLGAEHMSTLGSINNLAAALMSQRNLSEAEQMLRRALEALQRLQIAEHPLTLKCMANLATILMEQGDYSQAKIMHTQVLAVQQRVLGKTHCDTLMTMSIMAKTLIHQNEPVEAEALLRKVIEMRTTTLGAEHQDTIRSMNDLANVLCVQNRTSDAEALQLQTVKHCISTLGLQHPDCVALLDNLGHIWQRQGHESGDIERLLKDHFQLIREFVPDPKVSDGEQVAGVPSSSTENK